MSSPAELVPETQTNTTETNARPNGLQEMMKSGRRLLGRAALILGMASGYAAAINLAEAAFAPQPAEATEFVNDYPDMDATDCSATYGIYSWCKNGSWLSARGYGYRNCVDGASYWLRKYTGVDPRGWGNANSWDNNATAYNVKAGNTNNIEPGDIAQSDDGAYGHVGFVTGVTKNADGSVASFTTAELNRQGAGDYSWPNTYNNRNASGKFSRGGSSDWDHFIDVNGPGKGLGGDSLGGRAAADKIDELGFVRTNHSSGNSEIVSYHGSPNYNVLRSASLTAYPTVKDPENVTALSIDTNGDGIDELAFVRTNHSSGNTGIDVYHGSPNYNVLMSSAVTPYPDVNDPENVTPLAIDVNGDGIDELGFVRTNHSSGQSELVTYHGSPSYNSLRSTALTAYPAISDPANVTPLAIDVNGDKIDELAFVRTNAPSGNTEIAVYNGAPNYNHLLFAGRTGYPAIADPENVTPLAIDVNGDGIDELGFVRTNHYSGNTEIVTYHGSPSYGTLYAAARTAYPAISDPQNVTPLAIHLP